MTFRRVTNYMWHTGRASEHCGVFLTEPTAVYYLVLPKAIVQVHMRIERFIKFANSLLQHEFPVVRYIFKVALSHSNSVFTRNLHYASNLCGLNTAYLVNLDVAELSHIVNRDCEANCYTQEDTVTGTAIRDLVLVSQGQLFSIMDRQDALQFLNFFMYNLIFYFYFYLIFFILMLP